MVKAFFNLVNAILTLEIRHSNVKVPSFLAFSKSDLLNLINILMFLIFHRF